MLPVTAPRSRACLVVFASYTQARRTRASQLRMWCLGILIAIRLVLGWSTPPARAPERVTINVQQAPAWQLTLLPGVGPMRARALLRLRRTHPLRGPDDLARIPGMGRRRAVRIGATSEVRLVWADPITGR